MNTKENLIELLNKIDNKRTITEYTMIELQKIAEKAERIISNAEPKAKEISELKEAINSSRNSLKKNTYKENMSIMNVLRQVKFAIESFLYRVYGIEF